MTDTALVVGDRFTMKVDAKPVEIRDKDGRLLVRFLPGYSYRSTGKNLDVVNKMLADGECIKGGLSLQERAAKVGITFGSGDAVATGKVTVKGKGRKAKK